MSHMEKDVSLIFSSDTPTIFQWNKLLNYFALHKQHLNVTEMKKIVDKCEEYRLYINKNIRNPIERSNTFPNVYEYFEKMKNKNA